MTDKNRIQYTVYNPEMASKLLGITHIAMPLLNVLSTYHENLNVSQALNSFTLDNHG